MRDGTRDEPATATAQRARWSESAHAFGRIGLLSFGGPAAQIATMHRILVDEKKWLGEQRFAGALSFCMLLPGPEATQLAIYAGWLRHGVAGGLMAGLLFVLPGAAVMLGLATTYALYGNVPFVEAIFFGIKAAVLIIVVEALMRVARRALKLPSHWVIAALSFAALFLFALPFPFVIAAAAFYGYVSSPHASVPDNGSLPPSNAAGTASFLRTCAIWISVWLAPLAALSLVAGRSHILTEIGWFFTKLAIVTFGGAYAVLAYMAQDVVGHYHWLVAGEMMDGLGLAETTPGPLILVVEFVAFVAAFKVGGLILGLGGALLAIWVTFAPCFLWIFAGAPYIEWIIAQPRLKGALTAITAAVVGVILNLAVWFSMQSFFRSVTETKIAGIHLWTPDPASIDWRVVALAAVSAFLLLYRHWSIARVLAIAAALGLAMRAAGV